MSNFPAGSKIIITNPDRNETYKKGDIFTVANTNTNGGCGVHVTRKDDVYYVSNREFEAYTEFKVGDLVEVTAENAEWEYSIGDTGKVMHIDTQEPKIWLEGAGYVYTSDLKLVAAELADFKIGDKVRVLNDAVAPYLLTGDIGTVAGRDEHSLHVQQDAPYTRGSGLWWVSPTNVEHYTEPETEPAKKIKIIRSSYPAEYEVGDILEVHERQHVSEGAIRVINKHGASSVVFSGQWEYYTEPVEDELAEWEKELLEVTPRKIAFTDILKGDTIRAEYIQYGVKYNREGVAHETFGSTNAYWGSDEGGLVADTAWNTTYTLLERPEPPKTNPFEEAKVGSLALGADGYTWYKVSPNLWKFISKTEGDLGASSGENNAAMLSAKDRKVTYNAK